MVLQCKKGKYFATGEVFPLDIDLLMGAVCVTFCLKWTHTICRHTKEKAEPIITLLF